jgi:hypothetical protein
MLGGRGRHGQSNVPQTPFARAGLERARVRAHQGSSARARALYKRLLGDVAIRPVACYQPGAFRRCP